VAPLYEDALMTSADMNNSKPVGRVFCRRTQVIAVLTSLILSSIALAALAEDKVDSQAKNPKDTPAKADAPANSDVSAVFADIESLVKEYYPKAKIVRSADKLHFDYKARALNGTQSGLVDLSPESGGVAGDIVVKPGKYTGKERQPSETNMILHMVLFMAPYSEPQDHYFNTRLNYPPDAAVDFLTRFKSIISDQQKGNQEVAVKPAAAPVAAPNTPPSTAVATAPAAAATAPKDAAAKPPGETACDDAISALAVKPGSKESAQAKVSFGSRKLSKYSYPEGRFKVLLPGNPSTKYSNTLGMRSVDYSYPEANGAYVMSYLIAPGMIVQDKISPLLDAVCTNLAKTTKSVEVRRNSLTLQGYQGRQVELAPPGGKEQLARFRLYVVRRYVYIIGAAGTKAWVDSPVVAEYLNSLEVVPEYTASELRALQSAEFDRKREEMQKAAEARSAKFNQNFSEAQSRNRKDFERSQADFKYRRN